MSDYVVSLIRTVVPTIVGVAMAWLATKGLNFDSEVVVPAVTGICTVGYYAVVRFIEQRRPAVGVLLGKPAAPQYEPPFHAPEVPAA